MIAIMPAEQLDGDSRILAFVVKICVSIVFKMITREFHTKYNNSFEFAKQASAFAGNY